jgi:hypothetical protein
MKSGWEVVASEPLFCSFFRIRTAFQIYAQSWLPFSTTMISDVYVCFPRKRISCLRVSGSRLSSLWAGMTMDRTGFKDLGEEDHIGKNGKDAYQG